jgi:phosphatidylinositol alpha-1,6-mannosyltransferase
VARTVRGEIRPRPARGAGGGDSCGRAAFDGSHDAFVDGVTGVAPADESGPTLAKVLDGLPGDRHQLAERGWVRAADWARERFDPERYASLLAARLL